MSAIEEKLEGLKRKHYECEDGWYSCPKSDEGCLNEHDSGCTCGADQHNSKVDELVAELAALSAKHENMKDAYHAQEGEYEIALEQLRDGYIEIFALAIAGRADAAIVANQEFDARHVILEVKTLAEEHRKLRAELEEMTAMKNAWVDTCNGAKEVIHNLNNAVDEAREVMLLFAYKRTSRDIDERDLWRFAAWLTAHPKEQE